AQADPGGVRGARYQDSHRAADDGACRRCDTGGSRPGGLRLGARARTEGPDRSGRPPARSGLGGFLLRLDPAVLRPAPRFRILVLGEQHGWLTALDRLLCADALIYNSPI